MNLPIEDVVDTLAATLARAGVCVLQAPPGAGKTTRVPLALLERGGFEGRLVMLEPRRLATRAAAERMAETLGEPVGETVGYRMRGEAKVGPATRIEVVTEGILTRMIQSDPELAGVGCVVFDEFHERSLNADLGLALVSEAREALRPDLKLLVMSATLDAGPVADMLGSEVVTSDGRAHPVETRWLDRPMHKDVRFESAVVDLVPRALAETEGGMLVFLPGEGEIRRVMSSLIVPDGCVLRPLFGALPFAEQRAAIRPENGVRKIVLATSIAETSLTIEGVRVVVDAGRARRARFDPGSGMSRLVTEKVSRAEATQRQGRAGRVAPGICYRMWTRAEEGALPAFPPAEIEAADLTGLALELAAWGTAPEDLSFLTPPPEGAFAEAQALLTQLGALNGGLTEHGRALARVPVHPRLAHMLVSSGPEAAELAALLGERDPLPRGVGVDLGLRMKPDPRANKGVVARIKQEAKRLKRFAGRTRRSLGEMAALAYPDRVGLIRPGKDARYVLSGGKGAVIEPGDTLAGQRLIVALDLDGDAREAWVRLACTLSEAELRGLYGDRIEWIELCEWSKRDRRVLARRQERFGALVLDDRVWKEAPGDAIAVAMLEGVRQLGLGALNWTKAARFLRARVHYMRDGMPNWTEEGLLDSLEDWLLPYLSGVKSAEDLKRVDLAEALRAALTWDQLQALDAGAPAKFTTPLGRDLALDYAEGTPALEVRLQEMFGVTRHPVTGPDRLPLKITLLSPAQRPVQVTTDLPGFWAGSYADVRKDMRARYPRHPWPEDPTVADPTLRAKPRGT
ncbi:ATP-dependent helicase HrpB [Litoreibacter ponti]|uniref:ATP-dependent helicase HrpB n=1 Tax=Litoreibacter ponti TaxID=1510457 RepID=A0A2T6BKZ6_9RHOB|nr:ATP-dependent helicase HrpB [Litoreibacter ponti]PTX56722.1 ATP-dependent helicase HrpB [Litoreibacter ponti]